MDWPIILKIGHLIGTVLGVGGATFAEIFYLKAVKDGEIDPTENDFLKITYFVLRIGLIILVLSGFGYLILYRLINETERLYDPRLLAKLTIVLILLFNAVFFQARKIPVWLGSAVSLTSWYSALVLGAWRSLEASYWEIMIIYLIAIIAVALIVISLSKIIGVRI